MPKQSSSKDNYAIKITDSGIIHATDGEKTIRCNLGTWDPALRMGTGKEIIPDGVRFIRQRGRHTMVLFEVPPSIRQISWRPEEPGPVEEFRLAFPYIVFACNWKHPEHLGVAPFFRNEPLQSQDDMLYYPAIPNCMEGEIEYCSLPHFMCGVRAVGETLAGLVRRVKQDFFESTFNPQGDIYEDRYEGASNSFPQICSPMEWERYTYREPTFITRIEWEECLTVKKLLSRVGMDDCFDDTDGMHIEYLENVVFNQCKRK